MWLLPGQQKSKNLQCLKIKGPVVFKSDVWSVLAKMNRNKAVGSDGNFNRYCHSYMIMRSIRLLK